MDMNPRLGRLDLLQNIEVSLAGVLGVDAALHAHFGGPALPGLGDSAVNLLRRQVIGPAAQVLAQLALGKGAELALEVADVGVVDVAVDDVEIGRASCR